MGIRHFSTFASTLAVCLLASGLIAAGAHAAGKEKVISGSELKTDSLVDALDIGEQKSSKDEVLTRGMKPARPSVNRPSPDASGGGASAGRAPLMVTFKTGSAELTAVTLTLAYRQIVNTSVA